MSLRKIAKELGITPAYLSMMVNGKRPWREDLREGYRQLVNSVNKNEGANRDGAESGNGDTMPFESVVGGNGFEPMTSAMSTQRSKPLS